MRTLPFTRLVHMGRPAQAGPHRQVCTGAIVPHPTHEQLNTQLYRHCHLTIPRTRTADPSQEPHIACPAPRHTPQFQCPTLLCLAGTPPPIRSNGSHRAMMQPADAAQCLWPAAAATSHRHQPASRLECSGNSRCHGYSPPARNEYRHCCSTTFVFAEM
jgi:hypothetical protein